jgi:hypothetical protein
MAGDLNPQPTQTTNYEQFVKRLLLQLFSGELGDKLLERNTRANGDSYGNAPNN